MHTTRDESWGKIEYLPKVDDFVAHVCGDAKIIEVDRPLSAGCLLTARCNLRCEFCYGNFEALPAEEISTTDWKRIFERLKSWGVMRVDLSGGEPTLRKDFVEIAKTAIDLGLATITSTNGLVLSRPRIKTIPQGTRIHVSVDSGFPEVHANSRLLPTLRPSDESFQKTGQFIRDCLDRGLTVRVLTCIGTHNCNGLFYLAEHLASLGVREWNISRVLSAGRALTNYESRWHVEDDAVLEQVCEIRQSFPWMTVRYSDRTQQEGYFLLVLPDGSLATQYTDARDKVILGRALDMSLEELRSHPSFRINQHARKWIAFTIGCQESNCRRIAA
jgi:MoaA/NifB/PqqE/SkfB family radical SAM enzyme